MTKKTTSAAANIAKKLLEINAVKLRPDNPFTWASGILSPIYCDNRKTLSYPEVRNIIAKAFADKCNDYAPFDAIAGVATGAIAHGILVADRLNSPFIYVRSSKKKHGTGQQVEGAFEPGQSCIVIEDLISTGKSSLEAVDALRTEGLEVKIVLSIFSYQFEEAQKAFEKRDCTYLSLSDYSTLIEIARDTGGITNDQIKSLKNWRKDPRNWNK